MNTSTQEKLSKLWREREKSLTYAAMMHPLPHVEKLMHDLAGAYGQCAEELNNPPERIFTELGYNEDRFS